MKNIQVAIIIVTFNSEKYIEKCLQSVICATPSIKSGKIFVLDNNSSDNTVKKVESISLKTKQVQLIKNRLNIGFAKAINKGINIAKGSDYFLLLNPDTEINRLSIVSLVNCAEKNNAGIVGGSTYSKDGHENGSYFRFPSLKIGIFDFTNIRKLSKSDYWHQYFYYLNDNLKKLLDFPVDVVTGGFMMISLDTIRKVGLLDEDFFMYLEDVDYCLRAKAVGIRIFHCNKSKIIHYSGRSSANKDGIRHISWIASRKRYFLKHFSLIQNLIIQPIFLADDLLIMAGKYLKQ